MKRFYMFASATILVIAIIACSGCGGGTEASEKTSATKSVSLETVVADVKALKTNVASNTMRLDKHDKKFEEQAKWNKAQVATLTALTKRLTDVATKPAPPATRSVPTITTSSIGTTSPATPSPGSSMAEAPLPPTAPPVALAPPASVAKLESITEEELIYLRKLKEEEALAQIERNRTKIASATEEAKKYAYRNQVRRKFATKEDLAEMEDRLEGKLKEQIKDCFDELSKKLTPKSSSPAPPAKPSTSKVIPKKVVTPKKAHTTAYTPPIPITGSTVYYGGITRTAKRCRGRL